MKLPLAVKLTVCLIGAYSCLAMAIIQGNTWKGWIMAILFFAWSILGAIIAKSPLTKAYIKTDREQGSE